MRPPTKVTRDGLTRTVIGNGWDSPTTFDMHNEFVQVTRRERDAFKLLERPWCTCSERHLPWREPHFLDLELNECDGLTKEAGLLIGRRKLSRGCEAA